MNWFKENKFLAGLLIVLVLGVGALGYLILSATGKLTEATEAYESLANERSRLHSLKPYPSPENLKELVAQKEQATAKITELHKALAAAELPIEPMTPAQFQDKLRATVTEVKTLAGAAGTTFKDAEKFFLGFERYETTTPDAAAAPLLGRQLKALQWLFTRIIENKATEVGEFSREPLPEEGGKEAQPVAPPPAARDRGGKPAKDEKTGPPLVQPHVVDLTVTGDQGTLRAVLNDIVGAKEQFFIVRRVSFKNEKETPPKRAEAAAPAAAADPNAAPADPNAPAPAPAAAAAAAPTTYIVGLEKVAMTVKLEIIDFADPAPAPEAK